jgi:hypothetical protein
MASSDDPIVFLNNGDPVKAGLVPSLARTGNSLTGVLISPEGSLAAKRVDMLKPCVVDASGVARRWACNWMRSRCMAMTTQRHSLHWPHCVRRRRTRA